MRLSCLRLAIAFVLVTAVRATAESSVVCSSPHNRSTCSLHSGRAPDASAWGHFEDTMESNGWSQLWLTTPGGASDETELVQGFAAGYLEAALTHTRISQHYTNLRQEEFSKLPNATVAKFEQFVAQNDAWVQRQIQDQVWQHRKLSPYWHTLRWLYSQLDGLVAGYNAHRKPSDAVMDRAAFLMVQTQGDAEDIIKAVTSVAERPDPTHMSPAARRAYELRTSHCSALVKVADDFSELFTGHTMWWQYYAMLRVLKHQSFAVRGWAKDRMTAQISGYPGTISSTDDFYTLPASQMAVMETTIPVTNMTLFDEVRPSSILYWARVMVANYVAVDGASWMETFGQHNSGTYNNMWMVVDYKKFTPGHVLPPGTLTVGEQVPGYWYYDDQTAVLAAGHWPSFNKAFYASTAQRSGQAAMVQAHGPEESWQLAKRAQIFRRDVGQLRSVPDVQRFLRQNRYQTDPISAGQPCDTIACRGDLDASSPIAVGAIDGKVVSAMMLRNATLAIVSGPTHDDQPVYDWNTAPATVRSMPHAGQPQRFDFDWLNATM